MAETRIQKTSFTLANQFYQTQVAKEDNFTYFSTWFLNVDKRIPLIWVFPWLAFTFFFLCLQDDKNKLSIHGPQSCSNDMQESKKYELQSLNSQTTIDAFNVGSCWVWEKLTENSCHFILLCLEKELHTTKNMLTHK